MPPEFLRKIAPATFTLPLNTEVKVINYRSSYYGWIGVIEDYKVQDVLPYKVRFNEHNYNYFASGELVIA